jgi:hypothetical protein
VADRLRSTAKSAEAASNSSVLCSGLGMSYRDSVAGPRMRCPSSARDATEIAVQVQAGRIVAHADGHGACYAAAISAERSSDSAR